MSNANSNDRWWFALFGLGRAGQWLYTTLFVLAIPAGLLWFVVIPRWRFSDHDEALFRAARHGDVAGVERSLAEGARVNVESPVDGKTALSRAAIFGHADAVRKLLEHGADASLKGSDGKSALDVATAARGEEKDPAIAHNLDAVVAVLREAEPKR